MQVSGSVFALMVAAIIGLAVVDYTGSPVCRYEPASPEQIAQRVAAEKMRAELENEQKAEKRKAGQDQLAHCLEVARVYDKQFDAYYDENGSLRLWGTANPMTVKLEDSAGYFQFNKCLAGG
jgi:hypothetical protein